MHPATRSTLVAIALFAGSPVACSSDPSGNSPPTTPGVAGNTAVAAGGSGGGMTGTTGMAGDSSAAAGMGGMAVAQGGGAQGGMAQGGTDQGGMSAGGAGGMMSDLVEPTCLTPDPMQGINRANAEYIECDFEDQSIDFTTAADYALQTPARNPGYDPAETTVSYTEFGTAFTGHAVQQCHPFCYSSNLTIGVTFDSTDANSVRGEVLFDFPPTVAPIANAVGRDSLAWLFLDGPALPDGVTLEAHLVLESTDNGIRVANQAQELTVGQWVEPKYFPIEQGFAAGQLTNITAIGFRITASAPLDWTGVIYADHFQLRD
jgi:hypothetical protein